ncbi:hypothetical protein JX265_011189 [Neoarthrinium moseri]|uniref:Macro domain-like protein n=1 Tax=Neoarthrinium moseri TaxID=1658444 RepID=A0A9Q0AHR2_9PEZI|nr:uncharacterized protein JN550_010493 [Neoarthrinium moseri]KAI1845915.1 hypothetical protein JX266_008002 [Neoarthrinium moseri]KAI1857454.1 hypothetical protein JX265_011189 [Neoarthrinium moseri]KAI1862028.1 hypothetical protein JN550_010493 [Neoarthrinium moseri]
MTSAASPSILPHIHLLAYDPAAAEAWEAALKLYNFKPEGSNNPVSWLTSALTSSSSTTPSRPQAVPAAASLLRYTVHDGSLSAVDPAVRFDAVVSPANSYAILDGGFDDAISRAFSPADDYGAVTRAAQAAIYEKHRGYLPPGQCEIVALPAEWREDGRLRYGDGTGWGCAYVALCPTMRMPSRCDWDREVVYECVWSLLNAVERHNGSLDCAEGRSRRIESLLMTPLGTGTGYITYERWARQAALAIKHWVDAVEGEPERWQSRRWEDLARVEGEIKLTHRV